MRKYILISSFLLVLTMMFYYPIPSELLEKEQLQLKYKHLNPLESADDKTKTEQNIAVQEQRNADPMMSELQTP